MDGTYLIERERQQEAAHAEFWRRHQRLSEVALDLGEAQIRIQYR